MNQDIESQRQYIRYILKYSNLKSFVGFVKSEIITSKGFHDLYFS
jgi:negative regulator of genetic competence, sporulation and motility